MKKSFIVASVLIAFSCAAASATIINVPDDYETIQEGIIFSSDGDTVLVQPDTYHENINFNGHNIVLGSLFLTTGDTSFISTTIIDGDSSGSVVTFESGEDSTAVITGFTCRNGLGLGWPEPTAGGITCLNNSNPVIANNIICDNTAQFNGGGIFCIGSSPIIRSNNIVSNFAGQDEGGIHCREFSDAVITNNIVRGNIVEDTSWAGRGGGIYVYMADPIIRHNIISDNISAGEWGGYGGGIVCGESEAIITNNTIYGNSCPDGNSGTGMAGGIMIIFSDPLITNNIFWHNWAFEDSEIYVEDSSSPVITYCDIEGGWEGEGNIDSDPLFVDAEDDDFHLLLDSPCIDTGDPNSPLDPDGTIADIGAFFFDQSTGIDEEFLTPTEFTLCQNYPNPFNISTTIRYTLPEPLHITIDIYDILGRKVGNIIDELRPSGVHFIDFDASGLASGAYFYRLQCDNFSVSRYMILIK